MFDQYYWYQERAILRKVEIGTMNFATASSGARHKWKSLLAIVATGKWPEKLLATGDMI